MQGEKKGMCVYVCPCVSFSLDLTSLLHWWQETFPWKTMIVTKAVEVSRLFNKFTALISMTLLKTLKKICFEAIQLE